MTLDEAIKTEENIAEENQKVVDTGILFDDVTIDMPYCDDTEVIEEHLANYQICAERHRQLAEWLQELKRLKEQEPCEDSISRQDVLDLTETYLNRPMISPRDVMDLPSVTPQPKTGHWKKYKHMIYCSECGASIEAGYLDDMNYCHNCGARMESEE